MMVRRPRIDSDYFEGQEFHPIPRYTNISQAKVHLKAAMIETIIAEVVQHLDTNPSLPGQKINNQLQTGILGLIDQ